MAQSLPQILIIGHSFVRRLKSDLERNFDVRASEDFGIGGSASVHMHGVGGRTVPKLLKHDMHVVSRFCPDVVILEIGTNDLAHSNPEVVGSQIDELVRLLLDQYSVGVVVLCEVTPRAQSPSQAIESEFNTRAALLNQYTRVVLEHVDPVLSWTHRGFSNPSITPFLSDGVHFNRMGQYTLYRSYRGAILTALSLLERVRSSPT